MFTAKLFVRAPKYKQYKHLTMGEWINKAMNRTRL
jgi:hypothetical protein